jgi:hypothetical protein
VRAALSAPFVLSCLHTSNRCSTPRCARVYQPGTLNSPSRPERRKTEERGQFSVLSHPGEERPGVRCLRATAIVDETAQAERSCSARPATRGFYFGCPRLRQSRPMVADVSRAAQRLLVCACETTSDGGGGAAAATDGRAWRGWLITT